MIKKTLRIIGITVLLLILLFIVVTVVGVILSDEMHLSPWGTGFFDVASGSMEPNIPNGSIILVTSVSQDEISVGDIITHFVGSEYSILTHRVVEVSGDGDSYLYTTRGDANNKNDYPPLSYDRVIGRVNLVVPWSGAIIRLFGNVHYVGIAVIVVGAALCLSAILSHVKKGKKQEQEILDGIDSDKAYNEVNSAEDEVDFDNVLKEPDTNEIKFDRREN